MKALPIRIGRQEGDKDHEHAEGDENPDDCRASARRPLRFAGAEKADEESAQQSTIRNGNRGG